MSEYRDIPNHPGYRVGNDGSVWSAWKHFPIVKKGVKGCCGTGVRISSEWKQMKTTLRSGYPSVMLGAKTTPINVYVLVLQAFVGECPKGMLARHFDDNSQNNQLTNLAWGTRAENAHDQIRNGRTSPGEKNPKSKLTNEAVKEIRKLRGVKTQEKIAAMFGIDQTTVSTVQLGKTWRHI